MQRLSRSDESELRRKIDSGTASLLEEALLGEVIHLRKHVYSLAERLGVAWPAQKFDLIDEAAQIVAPPAPLCPIHGATCHSVWHKADTVTSGDVARGNWPVDHEEGA